MPGRLITTASADVTLKGLSYLLEALAKLRTERDVTLTVIGRPKPGGRAAEAIERLGLSRRHHVRVRRAGRADRGAVRRGRAWPSCPACTRASRCPRSRPWPPGRCLVATDGRRAARGHRAGRRDGAVSCPAGDADALAAHHRAAGSTDADLRARVGAAGRRAGDRALELAALRPAHRRPVPRGPGHAAEPGASWRPGTRLRPGSGRAADAHRPLRAAGRCARATSCSTWAAASAATPSRRPSAAPRRRLRLRATRSSRRCATPSERWPRPARSDRTRWPAPCRATPPGSRSPDGAFDRVIASEVLEHIPDDQAALERAGPRAAARAAPWR